MMYDHAGIGPITGQSYLRLRKCSTMEVNSAVRSIEVAPAAGRTLPTELDQVPQTRSMTQAATAHSPGTL